MFQLELGGRAYWHQGKKKKKIKVSDEEPLTFLHQTSCDYPKSTMADRTTGRGKVAGGGGGIAGRTGVPSVPFTGGDSSCSLWFSLGSFDLRGEDGTKETCEKKSSAKKKKIQRTNITPNCNIRLALSE